MLSRACQGERAARGPAGGGSRGRWPALRPRVVRLLAAGAEGGLLDRYLDMHTGGASTVSGYRTYVDKHVRPFIGTG